mmetsp:Transcript_20357/g.60967  ORF Transcript_20357/g.60967 Transcript_20357/m.60967 type:complete len:82 (-) Transcript_20357:11-256(-)
MEAALITYTGEARGAGRSHAVTGLPFQYTARMLPTMAIQTTLTAEGTRTLKAPKCSEANRKPKALLFMAVSMATVRQVLSS